MKFQFKIQQYQTETVTNVVNVFNGQPNRGMAEYIVDKGRVYVNDGGKQVEVGRLDLENLTGYRNADIVLPPETLLHNIQKIQNDCNIRQSNTLSAKLGRCQLDIEMETGTGKTYVYIKTMFELNRIYGWTKFIVVVPSIAIREGVKKSFDMTTDHFMEQYGKKAHFFVYNSDNLNQIDSYSQSADINVMIINVQAFNTSFKEGAKNKYARKIYDKRDEFYSRKPIDVLSANHTILILDEPQKMGGAATQAGLQQFKPLFTLNYSATHRDTHNPVYVLDALDAYNHKLVKRIEVVGFQLKGLRGTNGYVYLEDIIVSKTEAPKTLLEIEVQHSGGIKREKKKFAQGDSLYFSSGNLEQYKDFYVAEINPSESYVAFSSGEKMFISEAHGDISEEQKARIQIRETIVKHFEKESRLFHRGIKCLSLFFIDRVANYRQYDEEGNMTTGLFGKIFEEEYMDEMNRHLDLFDPDYTSYLSGISAHRTHQGYFSIDKKGRSIDNTVKQGSDIADDVSAYDLIMKNKEMLLSLDNPVRFIFSHSALREGWDNPNVFQICSLRQAGSVTQKRQEVGRGLRICVNGHGIRQDADVLGPQVQDINKLTVIATDDYASFVNGLQNEIRAELYDRPTKADFDLFRGKVIIIEDGKRHTISDDEASEEWFQLRTQGYVTKDGKVTDKFRSDLKNNKLPPLEEDLAPISDGIYKLVQSVFDPKALEGMVENASKSRSPENKLNDNFKKKESQELWDKINHKYAYTVSFRGEELIEKAVAEINANLHVAKLTYNKIVGLQKEKLQRSDFNSGEIISRESTEVVYEEKYAVESSVKYDLIGKIAGDTTLTRRTVAEILTRISPLKFDLFRMNPEEFIRNVTRLIMEQKATMIVEHITYNQIDGTYDSNIFTEEKHATMDKAYEGKKSVTDYIFTDGTAKDGQSNERQFVEDLEAAQDVVVYAKLPRGFYIPTPVGKYSPDWAIAFQRGTVKHVYFIAETKGDISSMQLRKIEDSKITCAETLFNSLGDASISYGKIKSYEDLMAIVKE